MMNVACVTKLYYHLNYCYSEYILFYYFISLKRLNIINDELINCS